MAGTCWGMRGVCFFFFPPPFLLTPWEARGEGWWKVGTRGKGKWSCCGRPRAGVNWGKNGVEDLGRERFSTPDGPKWTAQREGGGGECMNGGI